MVNKLEEVKVNSNYILEMCECVICTETFDKCTITKCGHSFCEKCILGCINLHNCCPTCKAPLKKEELIKNHLIDHITSYIKAERSKEEYNNILNACLFDEGNLNKIQFIFFDNLKQIFNTYNTFFQKLEKERYSNLDELNKKIDEMKKVSIKLKIMIKN